MTPHATSTLGGEPAPASAVGDQAAASALIVPPSDSLPSAGPARSQVADDPAFALPEARGRRSRRQASRAPRRGRRVKRIVRRIDLWSVFKLAIVLYSCLYLAFLAGLALVWGFLNSGGWVDRFEKFTRDLGDKVTLHGPDMFKGLAISGAVVVIGGTLFTVLVAALVNLVSEVTGGIRFTVIEEEVVRPAPRRRAGEVSLAEWEAAQAAGSGARTDGRTDGRTRSDVVG